MKPVNEYKGTFAHYNGMMRTKDLQSEKILYRPLQKLIKAGYVTKVRYGYYQWVNPQDFSEVSTVIRLFPDGIFCMDTALWYYGYSHQTPAVWHLAVSKDSGKSRFKIEHPLVKPHYVEPSYLEIGLTTGRIEVQEVRVYDRERVICDCLRARHKMDKDLFSSAIRHYLDDPLKDIPRLLSYTRTLRVNKIVREWMELWL